MMFRFLVVAMVLTGTSSASNDPCSICGDGLRVTNTDEIVYMNGKEITCGDLESDGLNAKLPSGLCATGPYFLKDICGCFAVTSDLPNQVASESSSSASTRVCYVCGDMNLVVNSPNTILPTFGNVTCKALQLAGASGSLGASDSDECLSAQTSVSNSCGGCVEESSASAPALQQTPAPSVLDFTRRPSPAPVPTHGPTSEAKVFSTDAPTSSPFVPSTPYPTLAPITNAPSTQKSTTEKPNNQISTTQNPTPEPSSLPVIPTPEPTPYPTAEPVPIVTPMPTPAPTRVTPVPTPHPTNRPTPSATISPTSEPSSQKPLVGLTPPSYPTIVPITDPTESTTQPSTISPTVNVEPGTFPACNICGEFGSDISRPDFVLHLVSGDETCAELHLRGELGGISPQECSRLPFVVRDKCACTEPGKSKQSTSDGSKNTKKGKSDSVAPSRSPQSYTSFSTVYPSPGPFPKETSKNRFLRSAPVLTEPA